jgi:uncharacterized linocin/CFP29 family protein
MEMLLDPSAPAQVDTIFYDTQNRQLVTNGTAAQRLLSSQMDVNMLRPYIGTDGRSYLTVMRRDPKSGLIVPRAIPTNNAATLRKDEWKQFDEAVVKAAELRLGAVQDLISRGLVYRITNGLGKMVLEYEDQSSMSDAEVNMDGVTRADGDRVVWDIKYLPLPIISKPFQITARVLAASRERGDALDTANAELAAFKVAEKAEDMLINGLSTYTFGGGTIYGLSDVTSANSVTLSVNWDASAKTAAGIVDDVISMKQSAINARHYGPYGLYIPTAYETVLDGDYDSTRGNTIRQRIEALDKIDFVKVNDKLAANTVVLVQLTVDTVRMVEGLPLQTVEWQTEGNMVFHYRVMTILVPQVRADQNSRSGVVVLS